MQRQGPMPVVLGASGLLNFVKIEREEDKWQDNTLTTAILFGLPKKR